MKKRICAAVALVLAALLSFPAAAFAAEPAVTCESYIIMDASTGQVILEKNADERLYPASITKIMTVGLALEKAGGDLDFSLTVPDEAVYPLVGTGSSHVALQPGEIVNFDDVVYATQMASANDGALVLAGYVGGTVEGGVAAMNRKVEELGLENTHFANPHGLMDENHYTSARDMALITRWALQQPEFETVFTRTDTWEMEPTNLQPEVRMFGSSDWMKVGIDKKRDYALGSKSGYHDQAGHTLVTLCRQGDVKLIGVLMQAPSKSDKFANACALMDYCFENFAYTQLPDEEKVFQIPVEGGGGALGTVQTSSLPACVLLHRDNQQAEVTLEYDLPESWVLGTEFKAVQRAVVPGCELQSGSAAEFPLSYTGLADVLAQSVGRQAEGAPAPAFLTPGRALAVFLVILAGFGLWVLWQRRRVALRRRQRAAARREEEWEIIHREWLPGPVVDIKTPKEGVQSLNGRPHNPRR